MSENGPSLEAEELAEELDQVAPLPSRQVAGAVAGADTDAAPGAGPSIAGPSNPAHFLPTFSFMNHHTVQATGYDDGFDRSDFGPGPATVTTRNPFDLTMTMSTSESTHEGLRRSFNHSRASAQSIQSTITATRTRLSHKRDCDILGARTTSLDEYREKWHKTEPAKWERMDTDSAERASKRLKLAEEKEVAVDPAVRKELEEAEEVLKEAKKTRRAAYEWALAEAVDWKEVFENGAVVYAEEFDDGEEKESADNLYVQIIVKESLEPGNIKEHKPFVVEFAPSPKPAVPVPNIMVNEPSQDQVVVPGDGEVAEGGDQSEPREEVGESSAMDVDQAEPDGDQDDGAVQSQDTITTQDPGVGIPKADETPSSLDPSSVRSIASQKSTNNTLTPTKSFLASSQESYSKPVPHDQQVVFIGRQPGCHVKLSNQDGQRSRIAAAIMVLKKTRQVVVMHVGGLWEIKKKRVFQTGGPGGVYEGALERYEDVQPIYEMGMDEQGTFVVGGTDDDGGAKIEIIVTPCKLCLVCQDNPRMIHFRKCHHFVTCDTCLPHLSSCPICREDIALDKRDPIKVGTKHGAQRTNAGYPTNPVSHMGWGGRPGASMRPWRMNQVPSPDLTFEW